ncbi:hypothetical protein D9M71_641420 [compost metagenome]
MAPWTFSRRRIGTSAQASSAPSNCISGTVVFALWYCLFSSSGSPVKSTVISPRGVSSGCSQKPLGGLSKKSRLARVSARTCGVP